jgi:hypothetical protein
MIIGLIGFKQVGKSTAAKYLEEKHGFIRHNFKDGLVAEMKQNFPDLLQEMVRATGMSIDELFANKPPLMRALMQNYGTEVRRADDANYWTNQWRLKGAKYYQRGLSAVADDVRFINESEAIKLQGGILIRLTRPDIVSGGNHPSETEQLNIDADYTIEGEPGNSTKLYNSLDEILLKMVK